MRGAGDSATAKTQEEFESTWDSGSLAFWFHIELSYEVLAQRTGWILPGFDRLAASAGRNKEGRDAAEPRTESVPIHFSHLTSMLPGGACPVCSRGIRRERNYLFSL
jgi:hypothetical protein